MYTPEIHSYRTVILLLDFGFVTSRMNTYS